MIATVWSLIVAHPFLAALAYMAAGSVSYLFFLAADDAQAKPPFNKPRSLVGDYGLDFVLWTFWPVIYAAAITLSVAGLLKGVAFTVLGVVVLSIRGLVLAPHLLANRLDLRHASSSRRRTLFT